MSDTNSINIKVLGGFFKFRSDSWESYERDASVVWVGENYAIVRTGMGSDRSRDVYLVDKIGLIVGADDSPLMQLAAEYHPSRTEAAKNPELLHTSCADAQDGMIFTGRWCKKMAARVIEYAKQRDAKFDALQQDRADAYDARERLAAEKTARDEAFRRDARAIVCSLTKVDDPTYYRFRSEAEGCKHSFDVGFTKDERIDIDNLKLTIPQFRALIRILSRGE